MAKYEVLIGFDTKDKRFELGEVIEENKLPKKFKWLVEQSIIEKHDENKVRARNKKGRYVADDPDTPENEAYTRRKKKKKK